MAIEITKIIEDDRHSSSTKRYDGCILKTKEPLTSATGYVFVISVFQPFFEKRIYVAHLQFRAAPAKLPEFGMQFENGDEMQVSGWGTTSSGGSSSDELRIVTVPFVRDDGNFFFQSL